MLLRGEVIGLIQQQNKKDVSRVGRERELIKQEKLEYYENSNKRSCGL